MPPERGSDPVIGALAQVAGDVHGDSQAEQRQPDRQVEQHAAEGVLDMEEAAVDRAEVVDEDTHDGEVDDCPQAEDRSVEGEDEDQHDDVDDRDDRGEGDPGDVGDALEEGGERVDAALALQADRDPDRRDHLPQEAHEDAPQERVVRECPLVWCCQIPQVHVTPPSLRRSRQGHTYETPPGSSVRGWTVKSSNQTNYENMNLEELVKVKENLEDLIAEKELGSNVDNVVVSKK